MVMNISCKFEKASYNIFFVRAVTVKSVYTLWRQRNKAKSIASTGCYPVDTMNAYVWCWSKICGSLDEIPSVTMGSCKSKILNKL